MATRIKKFFWDGHSYLLHSRRYWGDFFDFAVFIRIRSLKLEKCLPGGSAIMTQDFFYYTEQARVDFDCFSNWYKFSQEACDRFADDHFVLSKDRSDWFNQRHAPYQNKLVALRKLAERATGYIGKSDWSDRLQLSHLSEAALKKFDFKTELDRLTRTKAGARGGG
jgi:hypothetical protein